MLMVGALGCSEEDPPTQEVLQAPTMVEAVDGEVCLGEIEFSDSTIATSALPSCDEEGAGFGLVINQRSARVGVLALGLEQPRMINLDARRPGISQVRVGERPVDLAVNHAGNAAVVATQVDKQAQAIDLWTLQPLNDALALEGTPHVVESMGDSDQVVLATGGPNELHVMDAPQCERPSTAVDRRDHDPADNCEWDAEVEATVELAGRPVAVGMNEAQHQAWVGYRGRDEVSLIALSDEGLGDDETCMDGGDAPCEVERIAWSEEPETGNGIKDLDIDPLGRFVYALDRGKNEMVVIDAVAREVLDAAIVQEPTTLPFSERLGIPLVESANALMATAQRLESEESSDEVLYRFGADVASDNGQLYGVGTLDVVCQLEEGLEAGFDDAQRPRLDEVMDSDEMACLEWPDLVLGADPYEDDQEALVERRFVEGDGALLGLTPIMGIRDASAASSGIVGELQCEVPDALVQELDDLGIDAGEWCSTTTLPRPIGAGWPGQLEATEEDGEEEEGLDPTTLLPFAEATFDEDGEPVVELRPNDRRIAGEGWTVTYEGVLPGAGGGDTGIVDRDDGSVFVSGGSSFCGAGVAPGDRLTIQVTPEVDEACEGLVGEGPEFLSYEIVDSGPFELVLETIDGEETTDQLPSRECFPEAVNYQIRAQDAWVVQGQTTGFRTPFEADDGQCVEREDVAFSSRLEREGQFLGPYLRFEVGEAELEPVEGLSYSFSVQRQYQRSAESFLPSSGTSNMPAQVFETPDLGVGRWLGVADAGGNRIYIRNQERGDLGAQIVR